MHLSRRWWRGREWLCPRRALSPAPVATGGCCNTGTSPQTAKRGEGGHFYPSACQSSGDGRSDQGPQSSVLSAQRRFLVSLKTSERSTERLWRSARLEE